MDRRLGRSQLNCLRILGEFGLVSVRLAAATDAASLIASACGPARFYEAQTAYSRPTKWSRLRLEFSGRESEWKSVRRAMAHLDELGALSIAETAGKSRGIRLGDPEVLRALTVPRFSALPKWERAEYARLAIAVQARWAAAIRGPELQGDLFGTADPYEWPPARLHSLMWQHRDWTWRFFVYLLHGSPDVGQQRFFDSYLDSERVLSEILERSAQTQERTLTPDDVRDPTAEQRRSTAAPRTVNETADPGRRALSSYGDRVVLSSHDDSTGP